jgi:hypothetical protein
MELVVNKPMNDRKYILAPQGVHDAVCCDVEYLGFLDSTYQGKTEKKHKIMITWQLAEKMQDGRRFTISKRYSGGKNPKGIEWYDTSAIFKDLKSWFGKAPPDQFNFDKLVGQSCQVVISHDENNGNIYANIQSLLKAGAKKLTVDKDFIRKKDRSATGANPTVIGTDDGDGNTVPF